MLRKNLVISAILGLALLLTGSAFGQGTGKARSKMRRGAAQDGSGTDNANKHPGAAINNPFGLGGTSPLGKQRRKAKPASNFSWGESSSGQQPQQNQRRKQPRTSAKNQDIEVENDETHRTKGSAQALKARTETVDKNENHTTPHAKTSGSYHEGDTATHRTRPKRKAFPANSTGTGITQSDLKTKPPNAAKYDGIDGEANDARTKNPNKPGKAQNLLPYMEQDNAYKTSKPKRLNMQYNPKELGVDKAVKRNRVKR